MVHIFHFLPTSLVFEIVNPISWIFNAISSEKSCQISMPFLMPFLHQDTRIFPAWWMLIGQFKFPARQPYARFLLGTNNMHVMLAFAPIVFLVIFASKDQVSKKWKPALYWSIWGKECRARLAYGGWARNTIGSQNFGVLTKRYDNCLFLRG